MQMSREKPPLTPEEREEKRRLAALFEASKPQWEESHGAKLTQTLLAQLVGEMTKGEPITQGAIWQYLQEDHDTKLNAPVVQAIAAICGFEPSEVSPRFEPKEWLRATLQATPEIPIDELTNGLSEGEIIKAVSRWAEGIEPKLAMKLVQVFLSRASAEL